MTEQEWKLTREALLTRLQLYEAQTAQLQHLVNQAQQQLKELGPAWTPPADAGNPL
jgi:hypothetical protein